MESSRRVFLIDLADSVLRSWWIVVAGICFGLAAAMGALHYLPKRYEASAVIWFSKQQQSLMKSTVAEDLTRRTLAFKTEILKDSYMIELITMTFGLPETEEKLGSLMAKIRGRVQLATVSSRRTGVSAFELFYRDRKPERAAAVVNTLADLYILQNEEFRAAQATELMDVAASMAATAKIEYEKVDRELTDFKRLHFYETEARLGANRLRLEEREHELEIVRNQQVIAGVRLQSVEMLLSRDLARGVVQKDLGDLPPDRGTVGVDPRSRRIAELTQELDRLLVSYSKLHPDYIRTKREFDELLNGGTGDEGAEGNEPEFERLGNPVLDERQAEIDMVERETRALDIEETRLLREIQEYERRIKIMPEIQQKLNELDRRDAIARENYYKLQRETITARGGQELEKSDLGKRMYVLRYATVPTSPISPQPMRLYAMGLACGLLLFVGPVLARNVLNPVIVSEAGFSGLSDVPMLVSIPTIVTPETQHRSRRRWFANLTLAVLSGAVLVTAKVMWGG